jgi:L-Ala-D/L-Glu epimerase
VTGVRLELRRVERNVEPPQQNARGRWTRRHGLELALRDRETTGYGEAAPLPDYSRDHIDDCERALMALDPVQLAALDLGAPRELLAAAAAAIAPELPAARFALETALLDLAARRSRRPLCQLLAELVPGAGARPLATVALCALLPSGDPARALELARAHVASGVRAFKLKVGPERLDGAQEATLDALRGGLDGDVALRLDANQSLSRTALSDTLRQLARHSIEFLEEPLSHPMPEELADSPCPLALDELLQRLPEEELASWLERSRVRVVVLKPTALGGFGVCMRLALAARAVGCDAVISHALEGPIGWAACAHLALALGGARAAGLAPLPHQVAPLPRVVQGRLLPPVEPGIGGDR